MITVVALGVEKYSNRNDKALSALHILYNTLILNIINTVLLPDRKFILV